MPREYEDGADDGFQDRRPPRRGRAPTAEGTALLVAGLLSLVGAVGLIVVFVFSLDTVLDFMRKQEQQAVGQQKQQMQQQIRDLEQNKEAAQAFYGAVGAAGAVSSLLIIAGAIGMMSGKWYPLALIASFLAIIPLTNCCCLVATPIGIWSVVRLFNPEVKAAFGRGTRSADDY